MTAPSTVDETLRESFARVERAERYRAWILDQARPYLGPRVLEVGCGVGNVTADLLRDRERVVAIDVEPAYLDELRRRLGEREALRVETLDVESAELAAALSGEALDSALLLNVLEHVPDDVAALGNLVAALRPGGTVVVQVPAHPRLRGSMDDALGHLRRYRRTTLRDALRAAGLEPVRLWEWNALGVLGWLLNGRLLRRRMFSARQLAVYEAAVPLLRALEPGRGVPLGLSIMAVARTARRVRAA